MLAFYGWTNRLLLNLLNTKLNVFPNEDADLFVLVLDRVSQRLVEEIKRTGAFKNIFFLYKPPFHKEIGPLSAVEKVVKLLSGERYYHSYRQQLQKQCGTTSYRMLLSGAFWSETLFLFRYFHRCNPRISISMVEEGTTNYSAQEGWQFHCLPVGKPKERLMRLVYFPLTWGRARRSVQKIYLYPMEIRMRQCDRSVPAEEIPMINERNPVCQRILRGIAETPELALYRERPVIYIGDPIIPGYQDTFDETNAHLDVILKAVGPERVVIKEHPSRVGGEAFASNCEEEAFVDRSGALLDSILANLELENKLLITRNSSVPFSVKAQTGSEPYVIFTHHLYAYYKKYDDTVTDEAAMQLANICAEGKVLIPDTVEELGLALERWKKDRP